MEKNKKKATLYFLATLLCLVLSCPALAQSSRTWRGLTLDTSTTADAVSALGTPHKVKENQKLRPLGRAFSTAVRSQMDKSKRYTSMEFVGVRGTKRVKLYFYNDVLKALSFELEIKLKASAMERAYEGILFVVRDADLGYVHSSDMPYTWYHIGVTQWSWVIGCVQKGTFKASRVSEIQLISRTLVDARGLGALQ